MITCLLPKNENDYHLCPLCGHALISDTNPEEIYCPKFVDVHKPDTTSVGIRWNHFDVQIAQQGSKNGDHKGEHRYIAVIPPFYVSWYQESQQLYLSQFGTHKEDWRMHEIISYQKDYPIEDLLNLYKRLTNLRAFA